MKAGAIAAAVALLALVGCGGSGGGTTGSTQATAPPQRTSRSTTTAKLPPGAVGPVDTAEEAVGGPAATEASPGEPAQGPRASGQLSSADSEAVQAGVRRYVAALDHRDAKRVCQMLATGCRGSIGARPKNGGPAWRRTQVVSLKVERLSDSRARVSATVVHHFSDRKYVSVEDDVIYLEKTGGRWLVAKPSATFYRAVGYAQPPLRAFTPPPGW